MSYGFASNLRDAILEQQDGKKRWVQVGV